MRFAALAVNREVLEALEAASRDIGLRRVALTVRDGIRAREALICKAEA